MATPTTARPTVGVRSNDSNSGPILIAVALIAAGVLAAIIIAFTVGGDSSTVATAGNPAARLPVEPGPQVGLVQLAGDPLPVFDAAGADLALGARPPAIAASHFDGTQVEVTPGDGTPKVLLFLAHWCPHCQAEVASLTDWFAAKGVPTDVEIIAISTGVDVDAPNYPPSSWLLDENWPTPVVRDSGQGEIGAAYGLSGFPYLVAIDGDGRVISRGTGGLPATEWEGEWEGLLAALAGS